MPEAASVRSAGSESHDQASRRGRVAALFSEQGHGDTMMDGYEVIRAAIEKEVTQDTGEIRSQFLQHFRKEALDFVEHIATAFREWQCLDSIIGHDVKRAHVAALIYSAINLYMLSFKLFLSGYPMASGNLQRQVVETIALAILCSDKSLGILDRYTKNTYSSNKALRDLQKYRKKLGLNEDGANALDKSRHFYHKYSH